MSVKFTRRFWNYLRDKKEQELKRREGSNLLTKKLSTKPCIYNESLKDWDKISKGNSEISSYDFIRINLLIDESMEHILEISSIRDWDVNQKTLTLINSHINKLEKWVTKIFKNVLDRYSHHNEHDNVSIWQMNINENWELIINLNKIIVVDAIKNSKIHEKITHTFSDWLSPLWKELMLLFWEFFAQKVWKKMIEIKKNTEIVIENNGWNIKNKKEENIIDFF